MPEGHSNRLSLTDEQIAFFMDNSYLILRDVLDLDLCAQARDRMWSSLPEGVHLKREDPKTHMAGHNYSDVIRQAGLYDFTRTDLDTCRLDPPQENMWRDWSADVADNEAGYSAEFARSQGLQT